MCILLVISQHWLYRFYSLETVLVLALNVAAIALVMARRWGLAGLASGFALVGRADSVLLLGVLGLYILFTQRPWAGALWRFGVACAGVGLSWFVFAWLYFGSPFPNTLAAKTGFDAWATYAAHIWPKILRDLFPGYPPVSALVVLLAGLGVAWSLYRHSPYLIFVGWAVMHIAGYTWLRIGFPFAWYYAPLILITFVLASVGAVETVQFLLRHGSLQSPAWRGSVIAGSIFGIVVLFLLGVQGTYRFTSTYSMDYYSGARDQVYRAVGLWLKENTPEQATVALVDVGTVGFISDHTIIDLAGLVTYQLRDLAKQGTFLDALAQLRPDYVIAIRGLPPDPDLTGIAGYAAVKEFPAGTAENLYQDIIIYQLVQP
jgi:hypothetical protein